MYMYTDLTCISRFFFFKQKTAYEMRISDWSSDVCSSDLLAATQHTHRQADRRLGVETGDRQFDQPRFAGGNPVAADLEDFVVRLICCHSFHRNSRAAVMACSPRSLGARVIGLGIARSEERRVGKEFVITCRSRWSPYHYKKKIIQNSDLTYLLLSFKKC